MLRDQTKIVDLKEYIADIVAGAAELVTNSIKYGFPDERPGQILIKLYTNDELVISVSDDGGPRYWFNS